MRKTKSTTKTKTKTKMKTKKEKKEKSGAPGRRPGFTLMELMIVVGILAVVAGVATIKYAGALDRLQYDYLVRVAHGFLVKARAEAIISNTVQRVVVDFSGGSFERLAADAGQERVAQRFAASPKYLRFVDRSPAATATRGSPSVWTFYPDGLGTEDLGLELAPAPTVRGSSSWMVGRNSRGEVELTSRKREPL